MILNAASQYSVIFLYLFWITTIFQANILFKTNKCHHGGPLGAEGPGQMPPLPPPSQLTCDDLRPRWTVCFADIIQRKKVTDVSLTTSSVRRDPRPVYCAPRVPFWAHRRFRIIRYGSSICEALGTVKADADTFFRKPVALSFGAERHGAVDNMFLGTVLGCHTVVELLVGRWHAHASFAVCCFF